MKTSLETSKLFGIRKTTLDKVKSIKETDAVAGWYDNRAAEKAMVEAEHRKAEAITIIGHLTLIR